MSKTFQQSSFCKNCENFMDITNNISSIDGDNNVNLNGGNYNDMLESSDYDVSMSESFGGSNITNTNVSEILNGSDTEMNMKNFDIKDLNKNTTFNKLSNNQKTLVINRMLEKIPKNKKTKQSDNNVNKDSYYYCKSCGYNEIIPPKQFIFSRGDEKNDDFYNYRFINYVHDNTLPKTKNYNCINEKCSTHSNPSLKMATFYRQNDSYNVRYICNICNNFWFTFVEK